MSHAATHDPLTELPNRALFASRTAEALANRRARGGQVLVLLADLDRFKLINDTHGHHAGDELLILLAPRLAEHLPAHSMVARLGGDEFAFLVEDPSGSLDPLDVAYQLTEAWADPLLLERGLIHTSACLGVAIATDSDLPSSLLRNADAAMYKAKGHGPGSVWLYDDDQRAELARRVALEQALYDALPENQFTLFYHPVVNLATGRVGGAEALLRWEHPTMGVIQPGEFIPLAEEAGLIDAIGLWVLNQALGQLPHLARRRGRRQRLPGVGQPVRRPTARPLRHPCRQAPRHPRHPGAVAAARADRIGADAGRSGIDGGAARRSSGWRCRSRSTTSAPATRRCPTCTRRT